MKRKMLYCFLLFFVFAVCFLAGCATTRTSGIGNQEGAIEPTSTNMQTRDSIDQTSDANISSAIRRKFLVDGLSASDINIDTTRGRVTLSGKVRSQLEVDRAMQLGRSVDGVKSVRSSLILK